MNSHFEPDLLKRLKEGLPLQDQPPRASRRTALHTFYGGAHLFSAGTISKLSALSLKAFDRYAPDPRAMAEAMDMKCGLESDIAKQVFARVREKLAREPVEDYRIDFEDGYGIRSDEEEDRHARSSALELLAAVEQRSISPLVGIRVKPFTREFFERAVSTLSIFLSTYCEKSRTLPEDFCIALPKITEPQQVASLSTLLDRLEEKLGLPPRVLKMEIMIEAPEAIISRAGSMALPALLKAADGRCLRAHLGPYDYTSSLGIVAAAQELTHPALNLARSFMQICFAGSGLDVVDGPTNVIPLEPHKSDKPLSESQRNENEKAVQNAWRISYRNIRSALACGYYQGWDLHPAQLPVRYAASYEFFLESLEPTIKRMRKFLDAAAQASVHGSVFDDAASARALLTHLRRAITCGAVGDEDLSAAGLTSEALLGDSFGQILEARKRG